jgi:4-amino-4-deoxy-L-arabinose transferase-like glycosyltransferase
MKPRTWWLVLAAVLALAAFLRLWRFFELPPGLYADEAIDGNNAMEALETHRFQVFYPEDNGREGLYINLAALSIACFGNRAWALRLPAALLGIATVAGLAFLGAELFDGWVGLLAAFLLATSFWHVVLSREAFRAIAAPCFLTWAVYCLLAARRRPGLLVWAGAMYGLGFYTYIAYRATPLLMAALLRRAGWRRTARFTAAAAVVAAPLAVYFVTHPGSFFGRTSQLAVWRAGHPAAWAAAETARNTWRTTRMFFTHGDYNWRHNVPWRAELFWPVAGFLLLGVVRTRKEKWVPLVWLAVAALPAILSAQEVPHALRSILMLPPAMLLAALGAQSAYEYLGRRAPRRLVVAGAPLVLALLAWEPYHTYFDIWARDPALPRFFDGGAAEVAREIGRLPREEEKYVVIPPGADMLPQPVMFLTASYTPGQRAAAHIHYLPDAECAHARGQLGAGAQVFCLAPADR